MMTFIFIFIFILYFVLFFFIVMKYALTVVRYLFLVPGAVVTDEVGMYP